MQIRRHRRRRAHRGDWAPWRHLNGSALKNSSNLFLVSRAAAGVRGTELGGGRVEGHGSRRERARAAPRATTALTSRGGPWAAGRPPQAHLCISHLSGGAPAHCTPYERHLLSFWPLATTRRGITKGHDAAFTAIIRLITRHIIYGAACRAARDSRALVQIPARDAIDTTRRS